MSLLGGNTVDVMKGYEERPGSKDSSGQYFVTFGAISDIACSLCIAIKRKKQLELFLEDANKIEKEISKVDYDITCYKSSILHTLEKHNRVTVSKLSLKDLFSEKILKELGLSDK